MDVSKHDKTFSSESAVILQILTGESDNLRLILIEKIENRLHGSTFNYLLNLVQG